MNDKNLLSRLEEEWQLARARHLGAESAFTLQLLKEFQLLFDAAGIRYGTYIGIRRSQTVTEKYRFVELVMNAYSQTVIAYGTKVLNTGNLSKYSRMEIFRMGRSQLSDSIPPFISVVADPTRAKKAHRGG